MNLLSRKSYDQLVESDSRLQEQLRLVLSEQQKQKAALGGRLADLAAAQIALRQ